MFRTVPLSIIRSFSLYTQQWYMSYRFDESCKLYDIYHCCMYSEKLLMMDRGTLRNMQSFIPKINLRNQCIQLVLLCFLHSLIHELLESMTGVLAVSYTIRYRDSSRCFHIVTIPSFSQVRFVILPCALFCVTSGYTKGTDTCCTSWYLKL